MHELTLSESFFSEVAPADWWSPNRYELERMAAGLLGPMPGGWVRQGGNFIKICEEYGADAHFIDHELAALAKAARQIRQSNGASAALRAAAFFHLRFQRIHPLVEGNGRIGRLLLAMQLPPALPVRPSDFLVSLKDWNHDYDRVFASRDSAVRFELLLDLLARILGYVVTAEANRLPASLDPVHPQRSVPKNPGPRPSAESVLSQAKDVRS